jgi:hypothetical protein
MKTVNVSAGVIKTISESILIAAHQLDMRAKDKPSAMYDVQADFLRRLDRELQRALQDGPEYPGCVCVGYEAGQIWNGCKIRSA